MGQTVGQIEQQIEGSREDLRSNLAELGQKFKSAVDWRAKFRSNPGASLAVAFGTGFLLANVRGSARARPAASSELPRAAALTGAVDERKGQMLHAWDDIRNALVGVVTAKVSNALAEVVPGFKEQFAAKETDDVGNGDRSSH
jgi:hypothetical protein